MDVRVKQLVQESWMQVEPIADTAATLFYDKLFELDPSLRPMFPSTDLREQKKKLMQTLTVAVRSLYRLDELTPALEALGRRHAGYRVQDAHYATVGQALLWTLEQGLGAAFTPEVRDAWTETYQLIASVMQRAAREAAAEPAPVRKAA
jgi:hemoglobin-like flavoprotein